MSVYTVTTAKNIQGTSAGSSSIVLSLTLNQYNSTYYGKNAGLNNRGEENTFMGYEAGLSNINGGQNLFVGYDAGKKNVNGSRNTFLGYNTGLTNENGDDNTFIGYLAGGSSCNSLGNVALGSKAGFNIQGDSNIVIGCCNDVIINDMSSKNISIGNNSLFSGDSSILLGNGINNNTSNVVIIGNDISNPDGNQLNIGNTIIMDSSNILSINANSVFIPGDLVVTGNALFKNVNILPLLTESNYYDILSNICTFWGSNNNYYNKTIFGGANNISTWSPPWLLDSNYKPPWLSNNIYDAPWITSNADYIPPWMNVNSNYIPPWSSITYSKSNYLPPWLTNPKSYKVPWSNLTTFAPPWAGSNYTSFTPPWVKDVNYIAPWLGPNASNYAAPWQGNSNYNAPWINSTLIYKDFLPPWLSSNYVVPWSNLSTFAPPWYGSNIVKYIPPWSSSNYAAPWTGENASNYMPPWYNNSNYLPPWNSNSNINLSNFNPPWIISSNLYIPPWKTNSNSFYIPPWISNSNEFSPPWKTDSNSNYIPPWISNPEDFFPPWIDTSNLSFSNIEPPWITYPNLFLPPWATWSNPPWQNIYIPTQSWEYNVHKPWTTPNFFIETEYAASFEESMYVKGNLHVTGYIDSILQITQGLQITSQSNFYEIYAANSNLIIEGSNVIIDSTVVVKKDLTCSSLIIASDTLNTYWKKYIDSQSNLIFESKKGTCIEFSEVFKAEVLNFTGKHRCKNGNKILPKIGMIVYATGKYADLDDNTELSIDEALPIVKVSKRKFDSRAFGVVGGYDNEGKFQIGNIAFLRQQQSPRLIVQSQGEGCIWVCNINGNIKNGDYITSSIIAGYGMKQNSRAKHNYTIAKVTCDVEFKKEKYLEGNKRIKICFVGCIYCF